MESLNYAFQFVKDILIKLTNPSSRIAKLSQDHYVVGFSQRKSDVMITYNNWNTKASVTYDKP